MRPAAEAPAHPPQCMTLSPERLSAAPASYDMSRTCILHGKPSSHDRVIISSTGVSNRHRQFAGTHRSANAAIPGCADTDDTALGASSDSSTFCC